MELKTRLNKQTELTVKKIIILILCAAFILFSSQESVAKKDKRNSVGFKMLEIEQELGFDYTEENKTTLSNLLDQAASSIKTKKKYTKADAADILNIINTLLEDYTYFADNSLLSKALSNKQLDCNLYSLLYLHISDYLNLPLYAVVIPDHMFVRWTAKDYEIYWETTIGTERSAQYYIDSMNIRPEPIESGCYMENIPAQNIIGVNIYELLPVNNSDLNDRFVKKASELMPKYSMLIYALGMNYYNQDQRETAEDLFKKALKSNPYNISAKLKMSRICSRKSSFPEAKKYLSAVEREIEIKELKNDMTDKPTFYTVYGEYFRYQNKKDSAVVFYKKALGVSTDNSEAKRRLATLDSNFKNDEINLSDPVETYNKLAEFFNAAKYIDALRYTDILIKMNFNIEGVYYMKAGIHLNLKDTSNALKSFSKVIETGGNDSYKFNSLYNRGVIYYQQNQFKKALSDFQSALKIQDPGRDQLAESLRNLVEDCKRRLNKTAKPR